MKNFNHIFIVLVSVFLISCSNNKESKSSTSANSTNESDSSVVIIEHVYGEFDLCEPDPSLYPILDSVVNSGISCPELRNKELLYCLWIHKDEDSITRVKIESIEQKRIYCLQINKIFTYKGLIFNIVADKQFKNFYKYTGLKVKYLCTKENMLMKDFNVGRIAHWEYIIEKERIKCISYGFCDQHWMDERYFKMEKVVQ